MEELCIFGLEKLKLAGFAGSAQSGQSFLQVLRRRV